MGSFVHKSNRTIWKNSRDVLNVCLGRWAWRQASAIFIFYSVDVEYCIHTSHRRNGPLFEKSKNMRLSASTCAKSQKTGGLDLPYLPGEHD